MAGVRFRGSVVSSFLEHGWPGNVMEVDRESLTLRTTLLEPLIARREHVEAIEFRRMRLPLMWSTFIVVGLDDGYLSHMFVALRKSKVRRGLLALGWPVEDGPRVSRRNVLFSPQPTRDT